MSWQALLKRPVSRPVSIFLLGVCLQYCRSIFFSFIMRRKLYTVLSHLLGFVELSLFYLKKENVLQPKIERPVEEENRRKTWKKKKLVGNWIKLIFIEIYCKRASSKWKWYIFSPRKVICQRAALIQHALNLIEYDSVRLSFNVVNDVSIFRVYLGIIKNIANTLLCPV